MEAIVLAGGFGTRLTHVVSDVPKPMAPVCGKPFLQYILDDLANKGVDRVVLAVGYKRESIEEHFGLTYAGMELVYSPEDKPLFTGGAIRQAMGHILGKRAFVVNGDILFGDKPSDMECAKRMGIEARYIQNELGLTEKWQWDRTELEKNDGRP